jgi:predicted metal-dependent phosphoesterase TrpH
MNFDLHCHSTVSDGTLSPEDVVRRAAANGVHALALTDHDEVAGLARAQAEAEAAGIRFIPGVEVSVSWGGVTIHVVGLGIDADHAPLCEGLARTRASRHVRATKIAAELDAAGIPGSLEGALAYAGNPDLVSRTHFARFLVERGHAKDVGAVFQRYLARGKPGYVPHQWADLAESVSWIKGAGGRAVIAHPGRYALSRQELWRLFGEFKAAGGEGIEVVTGSHTRDQFGQFAGVAREFGFLASRGSDFHSPDEGGFDLGEIPALPGDLQPVWHDW